MEKRLRDWYRIRMMADGQTADINIYDEIGPSFCGEPAVNAASFSKELDALPDTVRTIRVHVNSPGGDVFDAITIANRLRAERDKGRAVECIVEGMAASAATIVTSAGNPIRIADNAMMLTHNPRVSGRGTATQMLQMAEQLGLVRDNIIRTYQWSSSKSADELGKIMRDDDTWLDAQQAVEWGLAHEIVSGVQVTASLRDSSLDRLGEIPERMRPKVDALRIRPADSTATLPPQITRKQLTEQAPQLLQDLLAEGRAAGVQQERQRIRSLESHALPGHASLLAAAKYGRPAADGQEAVEPMTIEAFAVAVIAAERSVRDRHLQATAEDAAELSGIVPAAVDRSNEEEAGLLARLIKVGADAASSVRRMR